MCDTGPRLVRRSCTDGANHTYRPLPNQSNRRLTITMRIKTLLLAAIVSLAFTVSAVASPTNEPPPVGAILDLNGAPMSSSFQTYTVNFTAALANTDITFAFRNDPSFTFFENPSVVDLTTSSGNLFTNGDFSGGTYNSNGNTQTPVGWEYANIYGATYGGVLINCGAANCWYDGAVQAYDAIDQTIATHPGDLYQISFLQGADGGSIYSRLSTNGNVTGTGGNGIDTLVYAQAGLPARVPEPASLVMLGAGLLGMAGMVRRRIGR